MTSAIRDSDRVCTRCSQHPAVDIRWSLDGEWVLGKICSVCLWDSLKKSPLPPDDLDKDEFYDD